MTARILFHPRMSGADIARFCWTHKVVVAARVRETQVFAWVDQTVPSPKHGLHPDTEFACEVCTWSGPHPHFVDTCDHYNPPLGEVPACPACGSFRVSILGAQ